MRNTSTRLAAALTMVLTAAAFSTALLAATPARAATVPAASAKEIAVSLTSAFVTTADLAMKVRKAAGKTAADDVKRGVAVVDHLMASADRLGNGHPSLAPGFDHVRANLKGVLVDGKVSAKAAALLDESVAELHVLIINAYILEAIADLGSAADALDKKNGSEVVFYLKNAEQALQKANDRGAYHIQNDIEEIQAALGDLEAKVSAKVAVPRAAIEMRAAEIEAHLFELGAE